MRLYTSCLLLLFSISLSAQQSLLQPTDDGLYRFQNQEAFSTLAELPTLDYQAAPPKTHSITLLTPQGDVQEFYLWRTEVGSPNLHQFFPGVITFGGMAKDDPSIMLRGEWTSADVRYAPQAAGQFSVMVFDRPETWVIRPNADNANLYEMGTRSDYEHLRQPFVCELDDAGHAHDHDHEFQTPPPPSSSAAPYAIGEELRIYRIAVATTADYSDYHGNTLETIMPAVMASVNRVNQVYESDMSVSMRLIDSTFKTFFIDDDPFGGNVLGISHEVIRDSVGLNSFDVGHVFDVGGGGVAFLRSVCDQGDKGRGYTSLSPPEGDPFDIDYLAHELGHQYGGNHTFNACSGPGPQPYEPGSGVTIMAYAGICNSNNVANRSIPQFHAASISEMTQFTQFGGGNTCPVIMGLNNVPPVVSAVQPGNNVVPINTPFELEATAFDDDDDSQLTYNWEQFQTGPNVQLGDASGTSPLFRNFNHTANPVRVFPRMQLILSGVNSPSEILPDYNRSLAFRVVARDNNPGGGGVFWDNLNATANTSGGAFTVGSQAEAGINWTPGEVAIIEWERGNTHQPPFSTDSVDIYLSADPLNGFPEYLGRYENSGQAFAIVPDLPDNDSYRVKVKGADRIWFNINSEDFSISNDGAPAVAMSTLQDELSICGPGDDNLDFFLSLLNGASGEPVFSLSGVPAEVQFNVTTTDLLDGRSYNLEIISDATAASGDYNATLDVEVDGLMSSVPFRLILESEGVLAPTGLAPADGTDRVSVAGPLSWVDDAPGERSYEIQISTDTTGGNWEISEVITTTDYVPATNFMEETTYFWRVRTLSDRCGEGDWSVVQSFTTERLVCLSYTATDTPQEMGTGLFISSRIAVEEDYPIRSIRIFDIQGIYDDFGDLRFRLTTPDAGSFNLVEQSNCPTNNFNFNISDASEIDIICSQVNAGGIWRSAEPLDEIRNSSSMGNWRLRVFDQSTEGELSNWSVEICVPDQLVSVENGGLVPTAFEVYPNPGQDRLYFRWSDLPHAPQVVRLVDITGREVLTYRAALPSQAHQIELETTKLAAGMYVYQVLTTDGRLLSSGRWVKN
ncbi:MAG: reprolysin-like metallopeptidase [Bacteroidota bacterium]